MGCGNAQMSDMSTSVKKTKEGLKRKTPSRLALKRGEPCHGVSGGEAVETPTAMKPDINWGKALILIFLWLFFLFYDLGL
jgi:hypothetical protein